MENATLDLNAELERIRGIRDRAEFNRAIQGFFRLLDDLETPDERWFSDMVRCAVKDPNAIPELRRQVRASNHPRAFALLEMFDSVECDDAVG